MIKAIVFTVLLAATAAHAGVEFEQALQNEMANSGPAAAALRGARMAASSGDKIDAFKFAFRTPDWDVEDVKKDTIATVTGPLDDALTQCKRTPGCEYVRYTEATSTSDLMHFATAEKSNFYFLSEFFSSHTDGSGAAWARRDGDACFSGIGSPGKQTLEECHQSCENMSNNPVVFHCNAFEHTPSTGECFMRMTHNCDNGPLRTLYLPKP